MARADGTFTLDMELGGKRRMAAGLGLEALARNIGASLDGVDAVMKAETLAFLQDIAKDLTEFHSADWSPGGTPGPALRRRSGRAIRSIINSVQVSGSGINNVRGQIGGAFYLRIHEYGGVITAKKSKYLTIPLPPALRANGTPKRKNARAWPNTFVITSKRGNKLICTKNGKTLVPLYLLKTQIRIPARLGMRRRLLRDMPVFTDRLMAAAHQRIVSNVVRS